MLPDGNRGDDSHGDAQQENVTRPLARGGKLPRRRAVDGDWNELCCGRQLGDAEFITGRGSRITAGRGRLAARLQAVALNSLHQPLELIEPATRAQPPKRKWVQPPQRWLLFGWFW